MRRLAAHLKASGRSLAETFRNPKLRRLQLAWVGSILGTWSYLVALAVYAYGQGGAGAVALVGVLRMLPSALASPFLAALADRFSRRLVMIGSDLVRAGLMGAATVVIASDGPAWIVYAIVAVSQVAGTPFRPAQAALLPGLARSPAELTAANVASSALESVGSFVGPALGGFLLAATNVETVFAVNGASFVWSALLVLGIRGAEPARERRRAAGDGAQGHGLTAGLRAITRDRDVGVLVALYTGQTLVAGALGVLVVVTALRVLDGGASDVGLLNAAIGVGGIAGGVGALGLAARGRLAADFGLGVVLFGAPLMLIAAAPNRGGALVALALVGIGNSLVDIAAVTLLQRTVPGAVLGRVLGLLEGILLGAIGLGALAAPLLIDAFGPRTTLLVVGGVLPVLAALGWPRLLRLDISAPAPARSELLRDVEILGPLPPSTLERLAASLDEVRFPAGATVIREGEPGDRFYVVSKGEVEIAGTTLGPGASFGEIALLRDVPRTATVTARTDVVLEALERDEFLAAVTGHEPSTIAADAVIARRLGEARAELATE